MALENIIVVGVDNFLNFGLWDYNASPIHRRLFMNLYLGSWDSKPLASVMRQCFRYQRSVA